MTNEEAFSSPFGVLLLSTHTQCPISELDSMVFVSFRSITSIYEVEKMKLVIEIKFSSPFGVLLLSTITQILLIVVAKSFRLLSEYYLYLPERWIL